MLDLFLTHFCPYTLNPVPLLMTQPLQVSNRPEFFNQADPLRHDARFCGQIRPLLFRFAVKRYHEPANFPLMQDKQIDAIK